MPRMRISLATLQMVQDQKRENQKANVLMDLMKVRTEGESLRILIIQL